MYKRKNSKIVGPVYPKETHAVLNNSSNDNTNQSMTKDPYFMIKDKIDIDPNKSVNIFLNNFSNNSTKDLKRQVSMGMYQWNHNPPISSIKKTQKIHNKKTKISSITYVPYAVEPEYYNLDHKTRKLASSCGQMKGSSLIGSGGTGEARLKIFTGQMRQRNPIQNHNEIYKGFAGKPSGICIKPSTSELQKRNSEIKKAIKTQKATENDDGYHKLSETVNASKTFDNAKNSDNNSKISTTSTTSYTEKFWMAMDSIMTHPQEATQLNNGAAKAKAFDHYKKKTNPFVLTMAEINQPSKPVVVKGEYRPLYHRPYAKNYDSNWGRFCQGNLGESSKLSCANCGFVLCKQSDVIPHDYFWHKGMNNNRNFTGLDEDDLDAGLHCTYSR